MNNSAVPYPKSKGSQSGAADAKGESGEKNFCSVYPA